MALAPSSEIAAIPELNIATDKVAFIIVKAREFDVKEADSDPDSGSNAADDGETDVLEDKADDPVRQELVSYINGLNIDEQIELVALAWLGRGHTTSKNGAMRSQPPEANTTSAPHNISSVFRYLAITLKRGSQRLAKALSMKMTKPKVWTTRMSRSATRRTSHAANKSVHPQTEISAVI
jgi:hypothetical protein